MRLEFARLTSRSGIRKTIGNTLIYATYATVPQVIIVKETTGRIILATLVPSDAWWKVVETLHL